MSDWMSEVTYDMLQPRQQELADVIGVEATLKLCAVYGGSRDLYIPKNDDVLRQLRDREIREDYLSRGYKVSALQQKYRLSDRTVQKVVRDVRPGQMRIEDFE